MRFPIPSSLFAVALFSSSASAETFYMKGGKKVVGIKQSEKDGVVMVKERTKGGVINTYELKKDEILKVTREDIEQADLAIIRELDKIPDLQSIEWYKEKQESVLNKFLTEFPSSAHFKEVKSVEKVFLQEMAVIAAGGLKIGGELISQKERAASVYDIDSQIAAGDFHESVESGNFSHAIGVAEKMEVDFPKSKAYGTVVRELPKMSLKYKNILRAVERQRVIDLKKLEKVKVERGEEEYNRLTRIHKRNSDELNFKIAKEREDGEVWLTVNRYDEESIAEQAKLLEEYAAEVNEKVAAYKEFDAGGIFTKAWKLVEKKDFVEAQKLVDRLEYLRFNEGYFRTLEEFCDEEKDKAQDLADAKLRGNDLELIDLYMDVDDDIQETIHEAAETIGQITEDEASAKKVRGRLRVYTARLRRKAATRKNLEEMDARDMEAQNVELAMLLKPLILRFDKAHQKALSEGKHLVLIKEPMAVLKRQLPKPDDFLTEESKRKIADQAADELEQAKKDDAVDYVKRFATRQPEKPVKSEEELRQLKRKSADLVAWEKMLRHCPTDVFIEYHVHFQYIFNFYKGADYDKFSFKVQVSKNTRAREAVEKDVEGKNLYEIIHLAREIEQKNPWVKELKTFKMKAPSAELE